MHSQTLARGIAAGAVLAAAALVLVVRWQSDAPPRIVTDEPAALPQAAPARDGVEPSTPTSDTAAADKIRELEAMSETFRNSTFLIAIRDAGFVCNELLRVSGGFDDSPKWMATCSETLAYTIGVASNGALHVQPFQQYFDGLTPRSIRQDFEPTSEPVLPPETLPQR
jgi:hypothetical protein